MIKISNFQSSEKDQLVQFWQQIYIEMGWPVESIEGTDDHLKYFHSPECFLLVINDKNEVVGCGGIKPLSTSEKVMKRFHIAKTTEALDWLSNCLMN